jgi:hypothetical protein
MQRMPGSFSWQDRHQNVWEEIVVMPEHVDGAGLDAEVAELLALRSGPCDEPQSSSA